jgi:adenylate kinase
MTKMILTILGAPGAGKGTAAKHISNELGIPTISTGALLRDEIASGSELGVQIEALISKGNFVPDEMITPILLDRLSKKDCENGYILDGYPRNEYQAKHLIDIGIKLDKALLLEVSNNDIVSRLAGRRECPNCRATYHIVKKAPKVSGICDICGTTLKIRPDDKEDIIKKRLEIYHNETEPLIRFFKSKGLLVVAKGEEELEDTKRSVFTALGIKI